MPPRSESSGEKGDVNFIAKDTTIWRTWWEQRGKWTEETTTKIKIKRRDDTAAAEKQQEVW
jgi:hypothetical protein